MATEEELYISISSKDYVMDKSAILMSQASLLHALKRLHNIKILARQRHDLKERLYRLSTSILNEISSIQTKMPSPEVPKTIKKESFETKSDFKQKKEYKPIREEREDEIENELRNIQAKLRELNS